LEHVEGHVSGGMAEMGRVIGGDPADVESCCLPRCGLYDGARCRVVDPERVAPAGQDGQMRCRPGLHGASERGRTGQVRSPGLLSSVDGKDIPMIWTATAGSGNEG